MEEQIGQVVQQDPETALGHFLACIFLPSTIGSKFVFANIEQHLTVDSIQRALGQLELDMISGDFVALKAEQGLPQFGIVY
jgi:hypothetical protein